MSKTGETGHREQKEQEIFHFQEISAGKLTGPFTAMKQVRRLDEIPRHNKLYSGQHGFSAFYDEGKGHVVSAICFADELVSVVDIIF